MARSTLGLVQGNDAALLQHLRGAVAYKTTQTTGTVMRTTPHGLPRRLPLARSRPYTSRPDLYCLASIDAAYLAANPYVP